MPRYAYRAVTLSGQTTRGESAAANENDLAQGLAESGFELIEAREIRVDRWRMPSLSGASLRDVGLFCAQMRDMLNAGLPFLDALHAAGAGSAPLRDALTDIARAIGKGGGIAESFARAPRLFPPLFTAILATGARNGDIARSFDDLARDAAQRAETGDKLRRALRYPLFLFFVAGGATAFMLACVVPQIVQFLASLQLDLPWTTRALISTSSALSAVMPFVGASGALSILLWAARPLFPSLAIRMDRLALRAPVVGSLALKTDLARFAHSFGLLFRSGMQAPDCLRQARATLGNRALSADAEHAETTLLSGQPLSRALASILPAEAVHLLKAGEKTGNLAQSFEDIATLYDREAQAQTDTLIGALEPVLTLAIGAVLAWTVLAVLGPLYGSLSSLGGRV